jgi:hypothetical protein
LTLTVLLPAIGQSATASLTIKDVLAPDPFDVSIVTVPPSPSVGFTAGTAFFLSGVTDTMAVVTEDNHALAWVGWTFGTVASDSIPLSGTSASVSVPITVPASMTGSAPDFSAFATDIDGNRTVVDYGPSAIAQYNEHPIASAPLPVGWPIADWAFDMGREVLYLTNADSQQIDVLSLATMQYLTPIATETAALAVDLTPDGNHLVVGLAGPGHPAVEVIDLTSAHVPIVTAINITGFAGMDTLGQIYSLRVAANNHAVVYLMRASGGFQAAVDLNVSTGAQQLVVPSSPIYGSADFVGFPPAIRSVDRTRVLLGNLTASNTGSTLYTEANATYSNIGPILGTSAHNTFGSADATGQYYQIAHNLVDGSANYIGTLGVDQNFGAVLAPNGQDFYVAECAVCTDSAPGSIFRYRIPTVLAPPGGYTNPIHPAGQLVEVSDTPVTAKDLIISPDGTMLIGLGQNTIFAMNLTHTSPVPASKIASRRRAAGTAQPARTPRHPAAAPTGTSRFVLHLGKSSR